MTTATTAPQQQQQITPHQIDVLISFAHMDESILTRMEQAAVHAARGTLDDIGIEWRTTSELEQ